MSNLWRATKVGRAATVRRGKAPPYDEWSQRDEAYAAGRRAAELEYATDRAALAQLATSLGAMAPPSFERLEAATVLLAVELAIVAAGAGAIDTALLAERARAAVQLLASDAAEVVLHLNPTDLALLETELDCPVVADDTLARGSVYAVAGHAWAADGVAEAVERIRKAFPS